VRAHTRPLAQALEVPVRVPEQERGAAAPTPAPPVLSTDVANGTEGYAESGYVGWIREKAPTRNTF
jgi:hypothetical protein